MKNFMCLVVAVFALVFSHSSDDDYTSVASRKGNA